MQTAGPVHPESEQRAGSPAQPQTRTRLDLAIAVQKHAPVSRRQSVKLVQIVIEEMVEALVRGEEVKLSGFGAFEVRSKAERIGRNPKNGEPATISPRRVVTFRASRLMKNRVAAPESSAG